MNFRSVWRGTCGFRHHLPSGTCGSGPQPVGSAWRSDQQPAEIGKINTCREDGSGALATICQGWPAGLTHSRRLPPEGQTDNPSGPTNPSEAERLNLLV